jgi:hypothetical protein
MTKKDDRHSRLVDLGQKYRQAFEARTSTGLPTSNLNRNLADVLRQQESRLSSAQPGKRQADYVG